MGTVERMGNNEWLMTVDDIIRAVLCCGDQWNEWFECDATVVTVNGDWWVVTETSDRMYGPCYE